VRSFWLDLRHAARVLRAAPSQFAAPVLALSLGVAAAVTLYTAFKVVADDLPPIPEPDRVARLYVVDPSAPMGRRPVRGTEIENVLDRATDHLIVTTTARRPSMSTGARSWPGRWWCDGSRRPFVTSCASRRSSAARGLPRMPPNL
jgi:hypothetical protein